MYLGKIKTPQDVDAFFKGLPELMKICAQQCNRFNTQEAVDQVSDELLAIVSGMNCAEALTALGLAMVQIWAAATGKLDEKQRL